MFEGTGKAYLDLKIYTTQSITEVKLDNEDDAEVTLDAASYFLNTQSRRILRDPGFDGTVTDPDDGTTFQKVSGAPTPWTVTFVAGYDEIIF